MTKTDDKLTTEELKDQPRDLILRPPGAHLSIEKPPEDPYAPEVVQAIRDNQDQPRSAELEIVPGLTITAGIRALYLNFGGLVASVSTVHHVPENFER